jgi:hypothetical protein
LILEPLRYATRVANFTAVFFRRSTPQITNPGGLWDEGQNFYPRLGGIPHVAMREWRWPRAGRIKFSHLQFDSTVYAWQGAQIALICFDELTHFTAHQFFYMVSRNRSTCGVRPYIVRLSTPALHQRPPRPLASAWRLYRATEEIVVGQQDLHCLRSSLAPGSARPQFSSGAYGERRGGRRPTP